MPILLENKSLDIRHSSTFDLPTVGHAHQSTGETKAEVDGKELFYFVSHEVASTAIRVPSWVKINPFFNLLLPLLLPSPRASSIFPTRFSNAFPLAALLTHSRCHTSSGPVVEVLVMAVLPPPATATHLGRK
jgi:hypothetical protein